MELVTLKIKMNEIMFLMKEKMVMKEYFVPWSTYKFRRIYSIINSTRQITWVKWSIKKFQHIYYIPYIPKDL